MIRQFDVVRTPLRQGKEQRPFFVILQSDYIDTLSRVCAPLIAERFLQPFGRMNPVFVIEGRRHYFHPIEPVTFDLRVLRNPIANLEADRDRIIAAIDLVFTGI